MQKKPVGTEEHLIRIGKGVECRAHLAIPTQLPSESDNVYAKRVEAIHAQWANQGIQILDCDETEAAKTARMAIAQVTRFIPTKNRHLPLLTAIRRKHNKYPRNGR